MKEALALAPVRANTQNERHLYTVPDQAERPHVQLASEAEFEPESQLRFNQWLGSLATKDIQVGQPEKSVNLLERLQSAKAGSKEALDWLDVNVSTAVFEVVFKEKYIGATYLDRDASGGLVQFGQTSDSIYRNAMVLRPGRHSGLQGITRAEALNRHRIETALKAGKLKDHYFVVVSMVPDGVPEQALGHEGDGYFLDSLTLNVQATTELANGRVKTETGFMSGVEAAETDSFEDRLAKRVDFKAVGKVYNQFNKWAPRTAEEALEMGLLIPKDEMPNGVADFMLLLDQAKDEVLGRQLGRKAEDYQALRLESKRKEASLRGVCEQVRSDLLAAAGSLPDAMAASQMMWDLVREHALKESLENTYIDPVVFGRQAAPTIIKAREQLGRGNGALALTLMKQAMTEAVITGCGGGGGGSSRNKSGSSENSSSDTEKNSSDSDSNTMHCVNCPKCGTYHEVLKAVEGVFRCKNKQCGHTAKAK